MTFENEPLWKWVVMILLVFVLASVMHLTMK